MRGQRGSCPIGAVTCANETTDKVLLVGDGVLQAIGALSILMSFLEPEREVRHVVSAQAKPTLQLAPLTLRSGSGLVAFGSF